MRTKNPTKYVTKKQLEYRSIDLDTDSRVLGSAGPYPNITGMRNLYWGKDACVLKHGAYAYRVKQSLYDIF